jgi:post-segregation antitoxin (ccd killing protein)
MKTSQKVVRRVRIKEILLDQCRAYYPDISIDNLINICIENEIRRKRKKRLRIPF